MRSVVAVLAAGVVGLSSGGFASADPGEDWAEQRMLLHAPYSAAPSEAWSTDFGDLRLGQWTRATLDGDVASLQLHGEDRDVFISLDVDTGEIRRRVPLLPGADCRVEHDAHLFLCKSGSTASVLDEHGSLLSTYQAPGEVEQTGVQRGLVYVLSHTAPGERRGNVALAVGPPDAPGSQTKVVFRLPGELPTKVTAFGSDAMGSFQPLMQLAPVFMQSGAESEAVLVLAAYTYQGQQSVYSEIRLDRKTGRVTVTHPSFSSTESRQDWGPDRTVVVRTKGPETGYRVVNGAGKVLASGPETGEYLSVDRIGDEANTVILAGCTVYDRATVVPLWSSSALCDAKEGLTGPVEAIVGSYLITRVIESGVTDQVFDLRTGRLLWEQHADHGWPVPLGFLTDGQRAIGTEYPGKPSDLFAIDLATGAQAWRIAPPGGATGIQKLGDGDLLVIGPSAITRYASAG